MTAFLGHCCECGAELTGIRKNRFLRNPNRKCATCYKKKVKGWTMSEGYMRSTVASNVGFRPYLHRIAAERRVGRELVGSEVVHHINEVRVDNGDENLKVVASPGRHLYDEHGLRPNRANGGKFSPIRNRVGA